MSLPVCDGMPAILLRLLEGGVCTLAQALLFLRIVLRESPPSWIISPGELAIPCPQPSSFHPRTFFLVGESAQPSVNLRSDAAGFAGARRWF